MKMKKGKKEINRIILSQVHEIEIKTSELINLATRRNIACQQVRQCDHELYIPGAILSDLFVDILFFKKNIYPNESYVYFLAHRNH